MFFVKNGRIIRYLHTLHSLQGQKAVFWQKTCFGALRKGVLTVELALILPLFLLGTMTLISFMGLLEDQTEKLSHLCERAMEAGKYAYLSGERLPVIDMAEVCTYRLPVSIVPLPAFVRINKVRVHSWTGADREEAAGETEEMVYIAVSGSVYHTDPACSYVDLSVNQVMGAGVGSLRNEHGARYAPCGSCSKGQEPARIVYVTGQGDRYHNRVSCSRLKRTVRLVPISQAADRPMCSRCGRKKG